MITQEEIEFIQHNQAWTGTVFNPEMLNYESFLEKARYAASLGKPMYLFINGKEKYPVKKLQEIIRLPWRKILILPEPFNGKIPREYLEEIAGDVAVFYYDKRLQ